MLEMLKCENEIDLLKIFEDEIVIMLDGEIGKSGELIIKMFGARVPKILGEFVDRMRTLSAVESGVPYSSLKEGAPNNKLIMNHALKICSAIINKTGKMSFTCKVNCNGIVSYRINEEYITKDFNIDGNTEMISLTKEESDELKNETCAFIAFGASRLMHDVNSFKSEIRKVRRKRTSYFESERNIEKTLSEILGI